ncbi:MAG: hypothetical protein ABIP94_10435 [Planctomycetota bacterium]
MNRLSLSLLTIAASVACLCAQSPSQSAPSQPAPSQSAPSPQAPAPKAADSQSGIQWKDLTKSGLPLRFYGFLRLDTYYNTARMDSVVLPSRVLPEVEPNLTPAAGQAKRNDDQFFLDPRLTRFGIDLLPVEVDGTKVQGKLEIDFANFPTGSAESRATPRIRVAYLDVSRGDFGLRAGQDWDVISPLFPAANHELLMWNAGNLGDRRAQIQGRYTPSAKFELKAALGLTGAINNEDLDTGAATGERDGFDSGMPHVQARAGLKPFEIVDEKPVELGVWGMYGQTQTDTFFNDHDRFDIWVAGIDWQIPVCSSVTFRGEAWTGQNLGDVRGGIGQTINTQLGREIGSTGGWAEVVYALTAKTRFHAGASLDDPDNDDLSTTLASANRRRNQTTYFGTVVDWDGGVRTGLDAIYWETDYTGPDGTNGSSGTALRINLYFQLNF